MLSAVVKINFVVLGRRARWDCASASHNDTRSNEIERFFFTHKSCDDCVLANLARGAVQFYTGT